MSETTHAPAATSSEDRLRAFDRYPNLTLADDTTIIYDRENPSGWIQSDTTIVISERS